MAYQVDEISRLQAGDAPAWEALYERVYPGMLAYAERRLGSGGDGTDAVSEALARAVAGVDRMATSGASPEAWFFGILRHVVIDEQRRSYRRRDLPVTQDIAAFDQPGDAVVLGDEQRAVRVAFDRLSDKDRELLELRVVAGLSADEVASVLDMRAGAVRTAQSRALARLRTLLAQDEERSHHDAGGGA